MEWKQSNISGAGLGVFAGEFIPAGTSYRILKSSQNLIILRGHSLTTCFQEEFNTTKNTFIIAENNNN